ncbi:MAG: prepilin peptidase [Xanthobacteraceae bacterium]
MSDIASSAHSGVTLPPLLPYPEQREKREAWLDRAAGAAEAWVQARTKARRTRRLAPIVGDVARHDQAMAALDDAGLMLEARAVANLLKRNPDWPQDLVAHAFAVIREAAGRSIGQRHYDVQLIGAYAMIRGMVAEMATGEGKTLAATLAAATAALGGALVHVVTVNSYLAARDAELMAPLYRFLGLSVGVVTDQVPMAERPAAYRRDITYCTNKDLAFDYMRDRLALGRRVGHLRRKAAALTGATAHFDSALLRGLHFAIVDEADSVLIDEARTPLIISGHADSTRDDEAFDIALDHARGLRAGVHYHVFASEHRLGLLPRGRQTSDELEALGPPWDQSSEREHLVTMALTALHVLQPDEHYLVRDGKVEIIDEFTGRILPDRTWVEGLHEMVERKEMLELSRRRATQARMTYQRFFRRYRRLAGMTGTAQEVAAELWRVYRLPVASIPLNRPDRKIAAPCRAHKGIAEKWRAISADVAAIHATGAPVLIGTRTVAATRIASEALAARGLSHRVLSAAQDAVEAEVIADAGQCGAITVATNMAGRGTDIRLSEAAKSAGGLHVIVSELHEAARIDRQLAGRCGRQGDPGEVRTHVCLDDDLIKRHGPGFLRILSRMLGSGGSGWWIPAVARMAQRRAERLHARMRSALLRSDEWLGDATAFVGEQE